jgi:hypothetical protein
LRKHFGPRNAREVEPSPAPFFREKVFRGIVWAAVEIKMATKCRL